MTRRYAMARVEAGVYLWPSDDLRTWWLLERYDEDGSLQRSDGAGGWETIRGTFWRAARCSAQAVAEAQQRNADAHTHRELLEGIPWEECDSLLPTRAAALEAAQARP